MYKGGTAGKKELQERTICIQKKRVEALQAVFSRSIRQHIARSTPTTLSITKLDITATLPRTVDAAIQCFYHMSASQVAYQGKRRCSQHSLDDCTEPQLKRQKHYSNPSPSVPLVHYPDTHSKTKLTREAIRELDRRTRRARSDHQCRPENHRPLTKSYHAESRSGICSTGTPASDFMQQCNPKTTKELKRFAKRGGPDLLDLRAVCA